MGEPPGSSTAVEFGRFAVVLHRRELLADGQPVPLGGRAFDTLVALIDAGGTVVGKDELMRRVWPDRVVEENNLQAQISALRRALGVDRDLIRTVAGRGYQFTGELHRIASRGLTPAASLPEPVSELIGRDTALGEMRALVAAHRLVTLVGAGGIGKTRLALELAHRSVPRFPDGVRVATLGPVSDPELVPGAVAAALGLTCPAGPASPEHVAAALGPKHHLLILDNCEHVIENAARMAEALLHASPGARVVATSREPLRADGEHVYRVAPLDLPGEDDGDPDAVLRSGAVRLFVARAQAAEPTFVPDVRQAAAMAAICRHLDGIPLAIELAAARVTSIGVDGVAARLHDRFRLLTGGMRTALPRHQTLRATLDWSYELLSEREQVVLRRLAVFAGRFSLDSAIEVVVSGDLSAADVSDGVANLVAKSLLSAEIARAVAHYRLLETTRAYALEKLAESGEVPQLARRHAEHCRGLLERAEVECGARPEADWWAAYGRHIDDIRSALDWAFSPGGDPRIGVAITAAAVPLWMHLSLVKEWRGRVEQALASLDGTPSRDARLDMRLFGALGAALLLTSGPCPEMSEAWAKALEIAERLDDTDYQLRALWGLLVDRFTNGQHREALAVAERFSRLAASTGDPTDTLIGDRLVGNALHVLGDQVGARKHLEHMLSADVVPSQRSQMIRFQFDQRVAMRAFYSRVLWLQGFPDQALRIASSSVDEARAIAHPTSLFFALVQAACPVAFFAGDLGEAERFVGALLDLSVRHALDAWNVWGECFRGMLLARRGDVVGGEEQLRTALAALPENAFHMHYTPFLAERAEALGRAGEAATGFVLIDQALARCVRREELWCLPELLRRKGELALLAGARDAAEVAEDHFRQALDRARRQHVLSWELRAATSLARLWQRQRRNSQARRLLAPVYGRLTEGFGTADLLAARALLDALR